MSEALYPPPNEAWLSEHEVELTGEFRKPQGEDIFFSYNPNFSDVVCDVLPTSATVSEQYGGKRWILKRQIQPPAPTLAWLRGHKVELTGEFRAPNKGDLVVPNGFDFKPEHAPLIWPRETPVKSYELKNKRYILRKIVIPPPPAPKPTVGEPSSHPKPSQAWLDKYEVELTGEQRAPVDGELVVPNGSKFKEAHQKPYLWDHGVVSAALESNPQYQRLILRKKSPTPVTQSPWDLDLTHHKKVVQSKDGKKWGEIAGSDGTRFLFTSGGAVTPEELLLNWTWGGKPCTK